MRQLARVHWERRCLECLRHVKVQSEPATGDRPLVQRLAHERVHEREAVDLLGILDDEPGRHRRLQRGDQLVELELARDDPESGKPEIGPQHGRQGERFQRGRRQSIQTTADHLLDALRHARGRLRRLSQAAHQLLDEERVAAGLLAQPLRQRDVGSLLTDASGDQRRRLRRVKTGEADTVEKTDRGAGPPARERADRTRPPPDPCTWRRTRTGDPAVRRASSRISRIVGASAQCRSSTITSSRRSPAAYTNSCSTASKSRWRSCGRSPRRPTAAAGGRPSSGTSPASNCIAVSRHGSSASPGRHAA